jgi:hypothetical protein
VNLGDRCGTCAFWKPHKPGAEAGYCRRFPPHPVFLLDPTKGPQISTQFPQMADIGWCGEHQAVGPVLAPN